MRPTSPTLTQHELEIMKIVWRLDRATVRDVYEALLEKRKIAYTSVMTTMKTLEEKGHLIRRTVAGDRAYVYGTARPQKQVIRAMVREFVNRVFDGSAEPLMVHLVKEKRLSKSDLAEIARMIQENE
ncbi:MAG TPA: BlaI/MecI/CopY family transcriptional regulator [Terriglobia bacterium]|nr:BlaI/MecI/CopY family transcriptional regulator [Terriglobia bacterium]